MNTGREDSLQYRDLARQKSRILRSLEVKKLSRICELLDPESDAPEQATAVAVELQFRLDEERRVWVTGSAATPLKLLCHRCAERIEYPLRSEFELCIVSDESVAEELAQSCDLLLVAGSSVSLAEIIEDELLLAIPEWLCQSEPCEWMPALAYPAAEGSDKLEEPAVDTTVDSRNTAENQPTERVNPFAVLKNLKVDLPEASKENRES